MTWQLSASGHSPAPAGETSWAEVEAELFDELRLVLSKPKYGCGLAAFDGNYVHGDPHAPAPAEDAATA